MKSSRFIDSLNCAIDGVLHAARTQKHMRNHFLVAGAVLLLALFLQVSAVEFILLAVSISFVLFAEMMNTAVEAVVDLVTADYHPLAKTAKDVAAGMVLIAAIASVGVGLIILGPPLWGAVHAR